MKTIITLLATTALVAGATGAFATDFQASDEAVSYALSHQTGWSGAYGSARGEVRNSTVDIPRAIVDFQAGGGN
jgi:hypothetical protein